MPNAHPHPYHAGSLFGDGPRRPLDREQRARFRFLLTAHRRARRLTPHAELIGNALVKRLSVHGQCDPGHDTIAADVGCCARTVRRALDALKALGLLLWQRRIVRDGWRVEQTSNAYVLVPAEDGSANLPTLKPKPCGGQRVHQNPQESFNLPPASPPEVAEAQAALARRRAAVEASLLHKGSGLAGRG
jgi:hypothetical protein